MDKAEAISTLKLFNEKVDKLVNSRFVKHIRENGLKVSMKSSKGKKVEISHTLPDQDAIDAFTLNIRFFIQDKDPTSLRNMVNLYNDIPVSKNIKDDYNWARDKLNSELDKKSMFNLQNKDLIRREIFDTFIYGELAHVDPKKKKVFDSWMKIEPLAAFIASDFTNILIYFLDCIVYIKKTNLKAIEELQTVS